MNRNKFHRFPIETVTKYPEASGFWQLYKNWWWITDTKQLYIYFYRGHNPMGNFDERNLKHLAKELNFDNAFHIQLPQVWVPHDCRNF